MKKLAQKIGIAGALVVGVVGSAYAELPAAVATGITTVETDGLALQALIWGPLIAITAGFVVMKLFKRGANKI